MTLEAILQWHKLISHEDNPSELQKYYGLISMIIRDSIDNNKNVIIHSIKNQVRAAQVFLIYLMIENKWKHYEAINYLSLIRPDIKIPYEYILELVSFEDNIQEYLINS